MAYYQELTYDSTGTKASINLDPAILPFNATVCCTLSNTATYKLQYSLSPMTVADADALWLDSGDIPSGTTTSATSGFPYPVQRVRAVIAALNGTLTVQALQSYSSN